MSTRSQITVKMEGCDWTDSVTLYHHCDGYPEHIIPCIVAGKRLAGNGYEAGRTGKVAAFLCAAHPGGFEPESTNDLHPDIEYHYTLYLVNVRGGSMAERPTWEVEIRQPKNSFGAKEQPTIDDMKVTTKRVDIEKLGAKYEKKRKATK